MGKGSKTIKLRQKERRKKYLSRIRRQTEAAKADAKQRRMG